MVKKQGLGKLISCNWSSLKRVSFGVVWLAFSSLRPSTLIRVVVVSNYTSVSIQAVLDFSFFSLDPKGNTKDHHSEGSNSRN